MNNKNKATAIVLGIFSIVVVTTGASFAFFSYSRTGTTKTTITTGDIEFSYFERENNLTISDQYPLADSIGSVDANNMYKFEVRMSGANSNGGYKPVKYNVSLVSNNTGTNNFTNDQIKFSLKRKYISGSYSNQSYVADTSETQGRKLSSLVGMNAGETDGTGIALADQIIWDNEIHEYELRTWISNDVNYSNTVDGQDNATSNGKYNSYTYSLRVKVDGELVSNYETENVIESVTKTDTGIKVNFLSTTQVSKYALTNSKDMPQESEWQNYNTAMNDRKAKVLKVDTSGANLYPFEFNFEIASVTKTRYYLHIMDNENRYSKYTVLVEE